MSRGYNNLNPGNLIKGGKPFYGEVDSTDTRFRRFISMPFGFRAMFKVLITYINNGFDTPDKIINRYAPPSENETNKYIEFVSKYTGFDRDRIITKTPGDLVPLAYAMATLENGSPPDMNDVKKGYEYITASPPAPNKGSGSPGSPASGESKKKTNNILLLFTIALISGGIIYYTYKKNESRR